MVTPSKIDKFELHSISGSYGPKGIWSTYEGSFANIQKCSVFVHQKNDWTNRNPMAQSDEYCSLLIGDIRNLCTISSNQTFLLILHTIVDLKHSLIFATELIVDSLSNVITKSIGTIENNQDGGEPFKFIQLFIYGISNNYKMQTILTEENIRFGIYQINQALMYLHKDKNVMHGSICPDVILITIESQWKLAGLWNMDLIASKEIPNKTKPRAPIWLHNMDFIAPETIYDRSLSVASDMFSLGMVIISVYNDGRSLISSQQSVTIYSLQTMNIYQNFDLVVEKLPSDVIESVEKMINSDPRYRPDTNQFSKSSYFKDEKIQCQIQLNQLWAFSPPDQQMIIEKILSNITEYDPIIRNGVFYRAVFRILENENENYEISVKAIFVIVGMCETQIFDKLIKLNLLSYLNCLQPSKNASFWMKDINKLIDKLSNDEIEQTILPLWECFLISEDKEYQKLAMDKIQLFLLYFNEEMIRKSIYPSLVAIFHSTDSIEIKNQVLEIIDRMITNVSPEYIIENIYPFIESLQISNSKLLQNAINIYNHLLVKKNVMNIGILATKTTPTLLLETVNESLNVDQFRSLMDLIHMIFDRISQDRISQYQKEGSLNFSVHELENTYLYGACNNAANPKIRDINRNIFQEESYKISSSISSRRLSEQCTPRKQESQPLLIVMPESGGRRHSYTLQNENTDSLELSSNTPLDQLISRPTQSKPSSRRPSNSDSVFNSNKFESHSASGSRTKLCTNNNMNENLAIFPEIRRSSFNSISNTVLDLFR